MANTDDKSVLNPHIVTQYKAWWENSDSTSNSNIDSRLDNYDVNYSKQKSNDYRAVLISSPSKKGNSCIPFTFQIFEDGSKCKIVESDFSGGIEHETEIKHSGEKHLKFNPSECSELSNKLVKSTQYIIPISNFGSNKQLKEESHSKALSISPLLIDIKTYEKTTNIVNTKNCQDCETLSDSNKINKINKFQALSPSHSDPITNQSVNNQEKIPHFHQISKDKSEFITKYPSKQVNNSEEPKKFEKYTEKKKNMYILNPKRNKFSDRFQGSFNDDCNCQLTVEKKSCSEVTAECHSESEEEYFIRLPLTKRKTQNCCCCKKKCRNKERNGYRKKTCKSQKQKKKYINIMMKNSSIVNSNTFGNCIILNKNADSIAFQGNAEKMNMNKQNISECNSNEKRESLLFSGSKQQIFTNLSKIPLEHNEDHDNSFNFHNLEENPERYRKLKKTERFENVCCVNRKNKNELKPLVDYIATDKTSKVNTKEKLAKFNLGNDMVTALYGKPGSINNSSENQPKYESLTSISEKNNKSYLQSKFSKFGNKIDLKDASQIREENENVMHDSNLEESPPQSTEYNENMILPNYFARENVIIATSDLHENKTKPSPLSPIVVLPVKCDTTFIQFYNHGPSFSASNTYAKSQRYKHKKFDKTTLNTFDVQIDNGNSFQIEGSSSTDTKAKIIENAAYALPGHKTSCLPFSGSLKENKPLDSKSETLNEANVPRTDSLIPSSNNIACCTYKKQATASGNLPVYKNNIISIEDNTSFATRGKIIAINSSSGSEMAQILYGTNIKKASAENSDKVMLHKHESLRSADKSLLIESNWRSKNNKFDKINSAKDTASLNQNSENNSSQNRKPCGIVPGLNIE